MVKLLTVFWSKLNVSTLPCRKHDPVSFFIQIREL